jgi:dihydrofolate synthase / folylpolyglutamate synthase
MSYAAAIDQLNAMTPELHTQPGQPRRKFSLAEIRTLLADLGDPHQRFPSLLIAGTNGKGSTAATLASIVKAAGMRVGLYTSPHLTRPNERIRVQGSEISDDDFARLFFRVHDLGQHLVLGQKLVQLPSFFETLTAMAFLDFAEKEVDLAVLEVGMGGRLDATNVVSPLVSIVTDISLDHTEWLGPTIAAITREKAGILRPNGTLITLPQHPEANQVLGEVATDLNARAVSAVPFLPQAEPGEFKARNAPHPAPASQPYSVEALGSQIQVGSPLRGQHQHRNVALAIAAAVELATHHGFPITPSSIEQGIRATWWPGRLECIVTPFSEGLPSNGARANALGPPTRESTEWILDVAHNPAGAWALRAALRALLQLGEPEAPPAVLIFGCLRDKPLNEIAQILFPLFDEVIFTPIHSPRATPMEDLLAAASLVGRPARATGSVAAALAGAEEFLGAGDDQVWSPGAARGSVPRCDNPGRRISLQGTSVVCVEGGPGGELSAEKSQWPRRVAVVAGSVYLVGEVRPLLLAPATEP